MKNQNSKHVSQHSVPDLTPDIVPEKTFTPTGKLVAVHCHKVAQAEGSIQLLDNSQSPYQGPRCTVIAVGPDVKMIKEGDLVLIHPNVIAPDIFNVGNKYVVLPEDNIAGVVLPEFVEKCLKGR